MSGKFTKTVGFSGQTQLIPITAPVRLRTKDKEVTLPILVSEQTPVNLLGRDALCKLKLQISCSPEGIYISSKGVRQMVVTAPQANAYWIGDLEEEVGKTVQKWEKFVKQQLRDPKLPELEFHCTMIYDPLRRVDIEKKWLQETKDKKVPLISQHIIVGPQGAALQVDRNDFIKEWFQIPNSVPHITLYLEQGSENKEIGPMMKKAKGIQWKSTDNPLIFISADKHFMKIACATIMQGTPREVEVNNQRNMSSEIILEKEMKQTELIEEMEQLVPEKLWSKHDTDVGLIKSASPIVIKTKSGAKLPHKYQYPLKPEAIKGIRGTIEGLTTAGVLFETSSPCNTPILPVTKADKAKWRLVHDLRAVNDIVEDWPAEVPNPHTLLTNVPPDAKYFTVIDLCSAFFSIPLAESSRHLFAFTYEGKQISYTRVPQGFRHSPHIFNQLLKADLEDLVLDSTLLQYVDDLLICAPTLEQCHRDSIKVLTKLAEGGHKASKTKLQYCLPQVEYLGRIIAYKTKAISQSQLEGISKVPLPQTVGHMMTFLGMTGFSSDWIEDYAIKTAPLRALMKQAGQQNLRTTLTWNNDATIAFESIKRELQSAPALTSPDYTKPFHLYVANRKEGYASAVLMQETCKGRGKQPIAFYSTKLDSVAQGYPPCYQGLAAVYYAYEKASTLTMGYPVIIYAHHKVVEMLEQGRFVLTQARTLAYSALLTYPDVTLKYCATVNPANYIPLDNEGTPHDCVSESLAFTRLRPDLESTPILNAAADYFVDGSCFRDHLGNHAGFAVVKREGNEFLPVISQQCEQPCSAQLAELKALTTACQLAKGQVVNIYTDSAYAHGVCHLYGAVWKQRGFRKSDGSPIQHAEQIVQLISAMMQPKLLGIIKCQAHKKGNDFVIQGNNAADAEARKASGCQVAVMAPMVLIQPEPRITDLARIQEQASAVEQSVWQQRGATRDVNGVWRSHEGLIIAPHVLLTVLISETHGFDHCGRNEILRKIKQQGYWSPYLQATVDDFLTGCDICAQNNVRKGTSAPIGHIPVPEGPFKHLVMDYVDMIKSVRGKRYMLVIIDRFSRWVEAVPSSDQGSGTVIKFLTREVIPRFGIPSEISSDNGSSFIQRTVKTVLQQLRIKQRLGCVYHPQSQGMVEKANGTLKAKISKICADTKLNWVDALPLALMNYRMQTNRTTNLTPHEMLTGRPMPVPYLRGPYDGPPLEQLQVELRTYMRQLTAIHEAISSQEQRRGPREDEEAPCAIVPGDKVYLRVFRRKWNEPRREGPYTVTRATPTAVQVEGSTTWYHLNHCTRVPQLRRRDPEQPDEEAEDLSETSDEGQSQDDSQRTPEGIPESAPETPRATEGPEQLPQHEPEQRTQQEEPHQEPEPAQSEHASQPEQESDEPRQSTEQRHPEEHAIRTLYDPDIHGEHSAARDSRHRPEPDTTPTATGAGEPRPGPGREGDAGPYGHGTTLDELGADHTTDREFASPELSDEQLLAEEFPTIDLSALEWTPYEFNM
ncbi:uncharacterized protein LOC130411831 [Triplophysa dalaica]|uniref:uncharacterized protein LOC130411831 n=2 Tax=Triplophysa dalaica TaxID=1582913 RepID=UPI0024E00A4D|nr:uncharacterized protein LOC130411831 [Triplophysa dalaica]